jgi:CheY-like chemotaxis protein
MPNASSSRPVVLLVEDEPIVLEIVSIELKEAGFDVIQARTGEEATRALDGGARVDLLFTDLKLPGEIDGWEVAVRARRRTPGLPVIYATGFSDGDPRRVAGSLLMSKPYHTASLIDAACALGVCCPA